MKIFFRRIHLYLSLAAGLVILVACLTGAILVFEKDLQMAMSKKRYYVEAEGQKRLPSQLIQAVKDSFPQASINGIKIYTAADRSAEVSVTFGGKTVEKIKAEAPKAGTEKKGSPHRQPGFTIFVNPYTGKVLEKYSYRETGFFQVFALHRWLLGGEGSVGKYIVGISTLIFLFILLTGIILWWPKTRKIMQQRLRIKWDAGWKRVNHDMHLVFGFYSAIFLFIIAFTGLAWSFEWFNNGIYTVTNSPLKAPPPPTSTYFTNAQKISIDEVFTSSKELYENGEFYNISLPKDSTAVFAINVLADNAVHENATDAAYFDQYTGELVGTMKFSERSLGAKVRSTFKPVHTGSIWGTPSKIVAFIVCVFGVTFPVTGTIMWINRTRKKPNKETIRLKKKHPEVVNG